MTGSEGHFMMCLCCFMAVSILAPSILLLVCACIWCLLCWYWASMSFNSASSLSCLSLALYLCRICCSIRTSLAVRAMQGSNLGLSSSVRYFLRCLVSNSSSSSSSTLSPSTKSSQFSPSFSSTGSTSSWPSSSTVFTILSVSILPRCTVNSSLSLLVVIERRLISPLVRLCLLLSNNSAMLRVL